MPEFYINADVASFSRHVHEAASRLARHNPYYSEIIIMVSHEFLYTLRAKPGYNPDLNHVYADDKDIHFTWQGIRLNVAVQIEPFKVFVGAKV